MILLNHQKTMEDIKKLIDELASDLENDLGDWQILTETDDDIKLKEKIIKSINDINND